MALRSPIEEGIKYNSSRSKRDDEARTPRAPGVEPDDPHVRHDEDDPDNPRNPGDQPDQKLRMERSSGRPKKGSDSKKKERLRDPRSDRITEEAKSYRTDQAINRPRHDVNER